MNSENFTGFRLQKRGPTSNLRQLKFIDPKTIAGWGADPLTHFVQHFFNHVVGSFMNLNEMVRFCIRQDKCIEDFLVQCPTEGYPLPLILCVRAHSSWRSAFISIAAGHHFESTATMRQTLECLGYAMMISQSEETRNIWRDRRIDPRARNHFSSRRMEEAMPKALNVSKLWRKIYEITISLGAHPNEEGVWGSAASEKLYGSNHVLKLIYLSEDENKYRYNGDSDASRTVFPR